MKNQNKIIYWVVTALFSVMMLMSALSYFIDYEAAEELFTSLGISTSLIYPLGIAKILGLIAIWSRVSSLLKEWAYAGFFFDFVIAFISHIMVSDGQWYMPVIAVILMILSYWYDGKVFKEE